MSVLNPRELPKQSTLFGISKMFVFKMNTFIEVMTCLWALIGLNAVYVDCFPHRKYSKLALICFEMPPFLYYIFDLQCEVLSLWVHVDCVCSVCFSLACTVGLLCVINVVSDLLGWMTVMFYANWCNAQKGAQVPKL